MKIPAGRFALPVIAATFAAVLATATPVPDPKGAAINREQAQRFTKEAEERRARASAEPFELLRQAEESLADAQMALAACLDTLAAAQDTGEPEEMRASSESATKASETVRLASEARMARESQKRAVPADAELENWRQSSPPETTATLEAMIAARQALAEAWGKVAEAAVPDATPDALATARDNAMAAGRAAELAALAHQFAGDLARRRIMVGEDTPEAVKTSLAELEQATASALSAMKALHEATDAATQRTRARFAAIQAFETAVKAAREGKAP